MIVLRKTKWAIAQLFRDITQVVDYDAHMDIFGSASWFDHLKGAGDEPLREIDES